MAHMKSHHKAAMHQSMESAKKAHEGVGPSGHGVSEHEGSVMGSGDFANMPQGPHMKAYPKSKHYRGGVLDDTVTGIDENVGRSEGKAQKYLSNQH